MTTITQTITPLPVAPDPATMTRAQFSAAAAAYVLAQKDMVPQLNTMTGQMNTVAGEVNTNATTASTAATTATTKASEAATSAGTATTKAAEAATSAATAANYGNALTGTSTTSLAIGTGSKSFAASTGKQWATGQFVVAASAANPANFMHGQVTSYDSSTGALVLNVLDIGGSGTKADWVISLSAPKGDTGATATVPTLGNRAINGAMRIDQRNSGAVQTFVAGAALAYCVDMFYGYCTGANITGQQVAGPLANTYRYRFTGAASNTGVGFGTRMSAVNTADMAGGSATVQYKLSSSSLTSITWTAYYATTKDTFGTLASPTRTQIATGTWTINSTEAVYTASFSVPSGAVTGVEIVLTGGALLAGQTLTIGDLQHEAGSTATGFQRIPSEQELLLCRAYWRWLLKPGVNAKYLPLVGQMQSSTNAFFPYGLSEPMRTTPTLVLSAASDFTVFSNGSAASCSALGLSGQSTVDVVEVSATCGALTANAVATIYTANTSASAALSAVL